MSLNKIDDLLIKICSNPNYNPNDKTLYSIKYIILTANNILNAYKNQEEINNNDLIINNYREPTNNCHDIIFDINMNYVKNNKHVSIVDTLTKRYKSFNKHPLDINFFKLVKDKIDKFSIKLDNKVDYHHIIFYVSDYLKYNFVYNESSKNVKVVINNNGTGSSYSKNINLIDFYNDLGEKYFLSRKDAREALLLNCTSILVSANTKFDGTKPYKLNTMPFLNKSDVYDICIKDYSNLTIDDMIYMGPDKNRDVKELSKQIFDL